MLLSAEKSLEKAKSIIRSLLLLIFLSSIVVGVKSATNDFWVNLRYDMTT